MGRFPEFVAELVVGLLDWTHVIEKHNKQWAENARAFHLYASSHERTRSQISFMIEPNAPATRKIRI
jgi:hypothetical protein